MKRPSDRQKLHQSIHTRKLLCRRFRDRSVRYQFRSTPSKNPYSRSRAHEAIRLSLPEVLSLEENHDDVMRFFKDFRDAAFEHNRKIYVDFTTLRKVHSCAALMLAAELDRWRRANGLSLKAKKVNQWDAQVRRLLNEMGLFELLTVENPIRSDGTTVEPDLHYLKFRTHNLADGALAKDLRVELEEHAGRITGRRYLFGGLTEAMTNVLHHAYPHDGKYLYPPIQNQWWMTGSVNHKKQCLTVIFFDQGVGIPATLPATYPLEKIAEFFNKLGLMDVDASRIKAAMELGRTATYKENRGKGLLNIRQFVEKSLHGRLRIISGRGEYIFNSDGSDKLITHARPIGGTLIQWIVYL